jgi:hypothetical protein
MKTVAIWKDHKVIGYCMMDEETRNNLNGIHNIGVYFGRDEHTDSVNA